MSDQEQTAERQTGVHPLLPQAVGHHQAGRLAEAEKLYQVILAESPDNFDAWHLRGVIAMQEARLKDAQQLIERALQAKPNDQAALSNLTAVYLRGGDLELAAQVGEQAALLVPPSVDALINYAAALHGLGRYRAAIGPLEIAHHLNPRSAEVCNLLGACLLKIGDFPQAVSILRVAAYVAPNDATSWSNLAAALTASSQHDLALECARKASELTQDPSSALVAEAAAQFELGKVEESIVTYERAVAIKPTTTSLGALARALATSGRQPESIPYLRKAIELNDTDPYPRMLYATSTLRPIYHSREEILKSRADFMDELTALREWAKANRTPELYMGVGAMQPFFAAYHPFNNRDLLTKFGDLCVDWMGTLPNAVPSKRQPLRSGKFRIGIASAHVSNHSVWIAIIKGWVYQLNKDQFEIYLFKLDSDVDQETRDARAQVAHFEDAPRSVAGHVEAIRGANLDVLIFDEIGMDAIALQLASLRLAPIQCTTWGHPETSGLPTVDFYLSGDAIEPPGSQSNYREKLVTLPGLGVYVEELRPAAATANFRQWGLPEDEPLLLCPGSPFKYSPLHDEVWIEIAAGLKRNGKGRLVFFSTSRGNMHVQLIERMRGAFAAAGLKFDRHVSVVPFLIRPQYYALMGAASLMLDTLDFSGFNTAMQAIEAGLPYLCYEGEFMRGRLASGLFRLMNIPELVASNRRDFAQRAVDLVNDSGRLQALRRQITERRSVLFGDTSTVRALERFLIEEITKSRQNAA